MQPGVYYLISYKPKTSEKFSSVQTKEKSLKLGLREMLCRIILYMRRPLICVPDVQSHMSVLLG